MDHLVNVAILHILEELLDIGLHLLVLQLVLLVLELALHDRVTKGWLCLPIERSLHVLLRLWLLLLRVDRPLLLQLRLWLLLLIDWLLVVLGLRGLDLPHKGRRCGGNTVIACRVLGRLLLILLYHWLLMHHRLLHHMMLYFFLDKLLNLLNRLRGWVMVCLLDSVLLLGRGCLVYSWSMMLDLLHWRHILLIAILLLEGWWGIIGR